jgi:Zn ribbon nucleic-acid-binding protein
MIPFIGAGAQVQLYRQTGLSMVECAGCGHVITTGYAAQ